MSYLIHNLRVLRATLNITATHLTNELNLNGSRITDIENSNNRHIRIREEEIAEIAAYFEKALELPIDADTLVNKKAYVIFK